MNFFSGKNSTLRRAIKTNDMKTIIAHLKENGLKYGFEILVITAGILLAFGLNNWNEGRKQEILQIQILKGLKANLTMDTIEINDAIKYFGLKRDSLLLDHLRHKRLYNKEVRQWFTGVTTGQFVNIYQTSSFDEAKRIGLHIIGNNTLRAKLSRLYEYDYEGEIVYRNEQSNDYYELVNPYLFEY